MPVPYAGTKGFLPLFSGVNALKNEGGAFKWGRFLWKNVSSGKVFGGGGGVDSYNFFYEKPIGADHRLGLVACLLFHGNRSKRDERS